MLIERETPGTFTAGPLDILCILKLPAGTFHAAFFEEYPMAGPIQPAENVSAVRLKGKMHHTTGAATLEESQVHLAELRERIHLSDANVIPDKPIEVEEPVNVWVLGNWLRSGSLEQQLQDAGWLP